MNASLNSTPASDARLGTGQLASLACALILWSIGNGLFQLIPVISRGLGASDGLNGGSLSFAYFLLFLGTCAPVWFGIPTRLRAVCIALIAIASAAAVLVMGFAPRFGVFAAGVALLWFLQGALLTLQVEAIFATAAADLRKRVLLLNALCTPAGFVLGGAVGYIYDVWGRMALGWFSAVCFLLVVPLSPLMNGGGQDGRKATPVPRSRPPFDRALALLCVFYVLLTAASYFSMFARTLAMQDAGFGAGSITGAGITAGLATVLLVYAGRAWLRGASHRALSIGIAGLFTLVMLGLSKAGGVFGFYTLVLLQMILTTLARFAGHNRIDERSDSEHKSAWVSRFNSMLWLGGIAGYSLGGWATQGWGAQPSLLLASVLPILAGVAALLGGGEKPREAPVHFKLE